MNKNINIWVTRPVHQATELVQSIQSKGWKTTALPLLEISRRPEGSIINEWAYRLNQFDAIIFTSRNAFEFCSPQFISALRQSHNHTIIAIGHATASTLKQANINVDIIPKEDFTTEGLLALPYFKDVKDKRFLIIKGKGGRCTLLDTLRKRKARVREIYTYVRQCPKIDISSVLRACRLREIHLIVLTSGDAMINLKRLGKKRGWQILQDMSLLVISPRLQKLAHKLGFKKEPILSKGANNGAIVTAIQNWVEGDVRK